MIRFIFTFLVATIFAIAPITTFAQNNDQTNQRLINELLQRIAVLQAELQEKLRVQGVPETETKNTTDKISITITSPNGGEIFEIGEKMNITWNSTNIPAKNKVSLSLMRRTLNDPPIFGFKYGYYGQTAINMSTPNDGKFTWTIPAWIPESTQYIVEIYGHGGDEKVKEEGKGAIDRSDDLFSILGGSPVEIDVAPNKVRAGSSVRVAIKINDKEVAREADSIMVTLDNKSDESKYVLDGIFSQTDSQHRLYGDVIIPASALSGTWVVDSVSIFRDDGEILARYWYPDEINKTFTVTSR